MAILFTSDAFVSRMKSIATNYKTLYVLCGFGAPLTQRNKERYSNNCAYNRKPERRAKIWAASSNTFAFDCVNLIKGVLWGWKGDLNKIYGGAVYNSNGVPDLDANDFFTSCCYDRTSNFSNIIPGEFSSWCLYGRDKNSGITENTTDKMNPSTKKLNRQ